MVIMEFQAVVMAAGKGSRMTDLTANCPKPLLPVGSYPLIWYPLHLLEQAGFEEAIVIVTEAMKNKISQELVNKLNIKIKLDFVDIPNEDWGTVESLRHIHDKIKTDVLIISCDLITTVPLHRLADIHRTHNATLTALFTPIPEELINAPIPGQKGKQKIERDFVGLDANSSRLLFLTSEADLDESLIVRKSLMKKHPNIKVHSKLMDAHLYLMKKWVLEYICKERSMTSLRGELIPHLIRKQFSQGKSDKDLPNPNASVVSLDMKEDIYSYTRNDSHLKLVQEMSSWTDHAGDMDGCYHDNRIRCYAYIMDGGFCMRSNILAAYCEANRQVPRQWLTVASNIEKPLIHPNIQRIGKPQISNDSVIGDSTVVGDKASIKKSVIGQQCQIGEKTKISNCIIMNQVIIEEGCNIQGTVICDKTIIGKGTELKDCLLAASQKVASGSKYSNEMLTDVDRMMEI